MRKQHSILIKIGLTLFIITGVLIGGTLIFKEITASRFIKALPDTAEDIHEWRWHEPGPLVQDHFYMLTAKMGEQAFTEYVSSLDFVLYTAQNGVPSPDWYTYERYFDESIDWWTPSKSIEGIYVHIGNSYWQYAKYENGRLYMYSLNI